MSDIDDDTVAYVLENRKYFEDLRQVTAQLAGLLVLAATGAKSAAGDHPTLGQAQELFARALDGIRHGQPTSRARPHHVHLVHAAALIGTALRAARAHLGRQISDAPIDPILTPLRAGYDHLQRAAGALPGFELIAFDQGCCARSGGSGLSRGNARGVGR